MAATELFDAWFEATGNHDAAAVRGLLTSDITDRCTAEEFKSFFDADTDALTFPEMAIKKVFIAAGDPESAIVSLKLLNEPRPGRQGMMDTAIANTLYHIIRENGRWLIVFQFPNLEDECPFSGDSSTRDATPAPGSAPPVR